LSLTAIVISFGLTLFLLALARRQNQLTGDDLVEDDLEDRRIASRRAEAEAEADRAAEREKVIEAGNGAGPQLDVDVDETTIA
ncbi:MAG: hypothetical protein WBM50_28015, partial [Acidimicrobiales bacterium]